MYVYKLTSLPKHWVKIMPTKFKLRVTTILAKRNISNALKEANKGTNHFSAIQTCGFTMDNSRWVK